MVSLRRPPAVSRADQYAAICAALWAERDLLQSLAAGLVADRITERASGPDPSAVDRLALQDVLRAAMVESLVATEGAPSGATLPALVATAPEPWATMLADHGNAMRSLLVDIGFLGEVRQLSLGEFLGAGPGA
jgi:hypothetical protein